MLKHERHAFIEKKIKSKGNILVSELSKELNCSEETIRRDIKEMESLHKLKRTHGGAYLPENYDKGYPVELRETLLKDEKSRMGAKAISFIKDHSVIMLDSSTTCLELVNALIESKKIVTVITNSLRICTLVNSQICNINLICVGGQLHKLTASFTGYKTTEAIQKNFADVSFISCPAGNIQFGLSDNNLKESKVRKSMLDYSHKKVLILDHTKIDSIADILFYQLSKIDILITDQKLSLAWKEYCKQSSIEVIYA